MKFPQNACLIKIKLNVKMVIKIILKTFLLHMEINKILVFRIQQNLIMMIKNLIKSYIILNFIINMQKSKILREKFQFNIC